VYDHIVFISIDTLRADGIANNPLRLWPDEYNISRKLKTAALDDLAGASAFFANTITAAPYTSASHGSIFTGLWPANHGVSDFFGHPLSAPTIFTEAARRGYRTLMKVDFPVMIGSHLGLNRDVDTYIVEDDSGYLDALGAAERSCSLLHFGSVHIPYGFHNLKFGGNDYVKAVEELENETRHIVDSAPADVMSETYRSAEDLALLHRYKRAIIALYAARQYRRLFELYLDGIEYFCRTRFETVMDGLRKALDGKRALCILFGDHGEAYTADTYGHFNGVDEGVLRVPLLFGGTDIAPGLFRSRVRTVDIVPTVYELLGWEGDRVHFDGASLASSIRGGGEPEARPANVQAHVAQADEANLAQQSFTAGTETSTVNHVLYKEAVYDGEFKLSRRNYVAGTENHEPVACAPQLLLERFDGELRPQRVADQVVQQRLLGLMNSHRRARTEAVSIPSELRRHLENHGYLPKAMKQSGS
jgi:choline-sulfatase